MGKAYQARDRQSLLEYNALDCVATSRVFSKMRAEADWNTPRIRRLYSVQIELARIAAEMHSTGILVDTDNRNFMAWALEHEYHEKESKLLDAVGIDGFTSSPNSMRSLIYKRHATKKISRFNMPDPIDPMMWSDKDRMDTISVDYDSLLLLITDPRCPPELVKIVDLYWDAESTWKDRSTFVTSDLISHAIGHDGRLRPGWNSCGTDTGRWSCSEPNVMQIRQALRAMYRAAPGHVLVHADYSQLELRVMMAVAGDAVLEAALAAGDVYSEDARQCFGLPSGVPVKKAARQQAKIIHLAFQYAAGTQAVYQQALAQDRSIQYNTVVALHKAMKQRYYRTVQYWYEEQERVKVDGYSSSRLLDRRRVYPREPPITEVANYPVQSTASDVANLAIIELDKKLKRHVPSARILFQLHDAFDVECPQRHEGEVRRIMEDVMCEPVTIGDRQYVFPVEIKSATHWHEV